MNYGNMKRSRVVLPSFPPGKLPFSAYKDAALTLMTSQFV